MAQTRPGEVAKTPTAVITTMRSGGVSLRYEERVLDGVKVGIHIYVVPTGRNPANPLRGDDSPQTGPIQRREITVGPSLKFSPFYVDIFALSMDGVRLLHSDTYTDEGDVSNLAVKYLRPQEQKGAILLLKSGFNHWKHWTLIGYPEGVQGKRSFVQTFLWGGESDEIYALQAFDTVDARGFLQITEREKEDSDGKERRHTYRWDGERFSDPTARYFVLAVSDKTREGVEAFIHAHNLSDVAEVIRTDRFPKLAPGLYTVVLCRVRTRGEADDRARLWRKQKIGCYVKQAL